MTCLPVLFLTFQVFTFVAKDFQTAEPIPNANIFCKTHGKGAATNEKGEARFLLEQGKHVLLFSHIGYEKKIVAFHPERMQMDKVTFFLQPRVIPGEELQVSADRDARRYEARSMNHEMLARNISVGEPDIFRAVQFLPGVSAQSDYASAPAIRGFSAHSTKVLLGNAPLLNPYHVGGMFSAFDVGMIESVEVYPGIAPVHFGDYGSGLLHLQARFTKKAESTVEIGLLSTKFRTLRSLAKNWQTGFSARYFTLDLIYTPLAGERLDYNFADIYWTNRWQPQSKLQIETGFYFSIDNLPIATVERGIDAEVVKTKPGWKNRIFSLKTLWRNLQLDFYHSASPMEMETDRNRIDNLMARSGIKVAYRAKALNGDLRIGVDFEKTTLNYAWHFQRSRLEDLIEKPQEAFFDDAPPEYDSRFSYKTSSSFVDYHKSYNGKSAISFGLRIEKYNQRLYPQPRLNFSWQLKRWRMRLAYGLSYQYSYALHEKETFELFTPFTIRFPEADRPMAIRTLSMTINPISAAASATVYFRRFHHFPVYHWNPQRYYRSHGFSAGLEIDYQWRWGGGDWQGNYTLATSRVAWQNRWQPTSQDRRHDLKIRMDYPFSRKWRAGLQFHLASGYPYSKVSHWLPSIYVYGIYDFGSPVQFLPRRRTANNGRYPLYHRFDVMIERDWQKWGGILTARLSVLNLFHSKNIYYYDLSYENRQAKLESIRNFPLLPSFHLVYKF